MNARELYERIELTDLADFVALGQEENLHLDFKLLNDAGLTAQDDKKNLARAISGFANSSGGLIVWGVDARKNASGIDCAVALKSVDRVAYLLTRLNSLTGDAVDPTVAGIQHRILTEPTGRGFALTLIPESDTGPHMAKLGDDRYYKRVGDSFYKMEHYDISDMFGRRRRPRMQVFYRIIGIGDDAQIHLGVKNEGRATARAPFFAFSCQPPMARSAYGLDGNRNEGLPFLRFSSSGYSWAYSGGMDFAIHPAMAQEIACLSLGIPGRQAPTEDVIVTYAVACEDQPIEHGTLTIPIAELR